MCHRWRGCLPAVIGIMARIAAPAGVMRITTAGIRIRISAAGFARIQETELRGIKLLAGHVGLADKKAKHTTEGKDG